MISEKRCPSKAPHHRPSMNPISNKMSFGPNSNVVTISEPNSNAQLSPNPKSVLNATRNKIPQITPIPPPPYMKSLSANSVLENRQKPRRKSVQIGNSLAQRISF